MIRRPLIGLACAAALLSAASAQPAGWTPAPSEYGALYAQDGGGAQVFVLRLTTVDDREGVGIAELGDDFVGEVMDYALGALPFGAVETVSEAYENPRSPIATGYVGEGSDRRAFAATLSGRGTGRQLVVLMDAPDAIAGLDGRVGSVSNFAAAAPAVATEVAPKVASAPEPAAIIPNGVPAPIRDASRDGPSGTIPGWTKTVAKEEHWRWLADPAAPDGSVYEVRRFAGTAKSSVRKLAERAATAAGLEGATLDVIEENDIAAAYTGERELIAIGHGADGRVFAVQLYQLEGQSDDFFARTLIAPQDAYEGWGGIAVLLVNAGVYDAMSDFPEEVLAALGGLPPAEQVAVFEHNYTTLMKSLMAGFMGANTAALTSMMDFNMATAACAGSAGCTVQPDGTGGYVADQQP